MMSTTDGYLKGQYVVESKSRSGYRILEHSPLYIKLPDLQLANSQIKKRKQVLKSNSQTKWNAYV